MDTEKKQRQRRRDDARLTESGNARSEQLRTRGAYRVANQQRMAAKRAPEWIRTLKSRLVFTYEISDLFHRCFANSFIFTTILNTALWEYQF